MHRLHVTVDCRALHRADPERGRESSGTGLGVLLSEVGVGVVVPVIQVVGSFVDFVTRRVQRPYCPAIIEFKRKGNRYRYRELTL